MFTHSKKEKSTTPKRQALVKRIRIFVVSIAAIIILCLTLGGCELQDYGPDDSKSENHSSVSRKQKNYGLYVQNGALYYTDCSENGTFSAADSLLSDLNMDYYRPSLLKTSLGRYMAISDDAERLFYPGEIEQTYLYTYLALYYKDLGDPDSDPKKIDDKIRSYTISSDGNHIVYFKGEDGPAGSSSLYYSDLESKELIDSDVLYFYSSPNGQSVVYITFDKTIYLWQKSSGHEKITGNDLVSYINCIADDFSSFYYTTYTSGYDGSFDSEETDIFRYDIKSQKSEHIASGSRFSAFYSSGTLYYADNSTGKLCYYDGSRTKEVAEYPSDIIFAADAPAAVCKTSDDAYYDCIIIKDKCIPIDPIETNVNIAPDGKAIYFTDEKNDLYKMVISGSTASTPKRIDENVSFISHDSGRFFTEDNDIFYFTDIEDLTGTLCVEGKEIASDVYTGIFYCPGGILMYYTGPGDGTHSILNIYRGGTAIEVAENVHDFTLTPNADILYLGDYTTENTVCFYNCGSGKTTELASGIDDLIYIFHGPLRGEHFIYNSVYYNHYNCPFYGREIYYGPRWDLCW